MPMHRPNGHTMKPPPELFHYTCQHGHAALSRTRTVVPVTTHTPTAAVLLPPELAALAALAWFTDLTPPDPYALGLTNKTIPCDRTEYRWRVTRTDRPPIGWGRVRAHMSGAVLDGLEAYPGAEPARWWVASWPVPVTFDPIT